VAVDFENLSPKWKKRIKNGTHKLFVPFTILYVLTVSIPVAVYLGYKELNISYELKILKQIFCLKTGKTENQTNEHNKGGE